MAASNRKKQHIVIEPWRPSLPKIPGGAARREMPPRGMPNREQRGSLRRFTVLLRLVLKDPTILWTGKPGRN
jgi:hypothetical protein